MEKRPADPGGRRLHRPRRKSRGRQRKEHSGGVRNVRDAYRADRGSLRHLAARAGDLDSRLAQGRKRLGGRQCGRLQPVQPAVHSRSFRDNTSDRGQLRVGDRSCDPDRGICHHAAVCPDQKNQQGRGRGHGAALRRDSDIRDNKIAVLTIHHSLYTELEVFP